MNTTADKKGLVVTPRSLPGFSEVEFPAPILAMRKYDFGLVVLCEDGAYVMGDDGALTRIDPACPAPPTAPERAEPAIADVQAAIHAFATELESKAGAFPAAYNWAAELRTRAECWLARLTDKKPDPAAPQAAAQGATFHTMLNHEREPHCCGCWVFELAAEPRLVCNECGETTPLWWDRTTRPPAPADLVARLRGLARYDVDCDGGIYKVNDGKLVAYDELRAALAGVKA